MLKQYKNPLFILFLIINFSVFSQTGSIRGFVYEDKTGEPVVYAHVYLKGTNHGGATDVNGYFNLTKIQPGKYTLISTALGYDTVSVKIEIVANKIINQKLTLSELSIMLDDAVVSAERQEYKTQIRTSVVKITPKQITQIPTIGAEPDLAQYLQILPGVIFTGDQGGQLYIRGGPPIQNKVLLDGMVVYNPFHSIGLFSVFDSDIIRTADVYTGGFNAEYGGRISSIMDITMRDGNKKKFAGKFSASPFGSKILFEGPLLKQSKDNKTAISYILSGKTSYLEQSSKLLYTYIDTAGLPFNFNDFYGKISLNGASGSKLNLFGFRFTDNVNYRAVSDLNWKSTGVGGNIVVVPSGSSALIKSNFSFSNYDITLQEENSRPRNSMINGFNLGLTFVYFIGKDELNYGIETYGFKTDFNYYNSIGRQISQIENTTELGAYLKYKFSFGKILFEPGFRIQYYASLSSISPEPRLGAKYKITDFFRLKFAGGLYSQNLIAANSDRDVVNLFYGFLSGPELGDLQSEFDGKEITHALQKSIHGIIGAEIDLSNKIMINIEGYIKQNTQLTNLNRNKLYDDNANNYDKPDYLKKDFIVETGSAYGADFTLKYDYKRNYIWFVYSLGYVTRYDGFMEYAPHFDRRHNVNIVMSRVFGDLNWEISCRWNLGSGFPFTKTQGYYESIPFSSISTDYLSTNGEIGVVYADLNQGRLPYYHRLDLTLKRKIYFKNESKFEAVLSVTNVYNRENIFYFDRLNHERVNQLPIMPSIGISYSF